MSVFSSPNKVPYYGVSLSSKLMSDDLTYRIMVEKMLELVKEQPGYLDAEYSSGETDVFITYWSSKPEAEAWLNNDLQRRLLTIGENCWYEEYSLKLFEVMKDMSFKYSNHDLYASRFPRIVTERGVLRILDESQAPLLYDYINQEKDFLAQWEPLRSEGYYSLETCALRIREMRRDFLEDRGVVFCFLSPSEDKMLAYTNYSNIIRGVFQACNLGYSIRESEQGKGIMHEALTAGLEYLSKELHIDRIQASYMPRNVRSAAVLKKLGFDKEGVARDYLKINGKWEDHILTALVLR
ncbi:GNAT family N-acetyltransferase [Marinomonas sp. FW-1]|uniref:GNAT family N-acetyltransferase n=1 Tax=Marinomonas sp. FW-1 TaxID=2071621 RepID=UPI0010BF9158|nr:GNAT family N-acetyltransferase [Marinomonas sp. FW-1]